MIFDNLQNQRLCARPSGGNFLPLRVAKENGGWRKRQERQYLNQQAAGRDGNRKILAPLGAEERVVP